MVEVRTLPSLTLENYSEKTKNVIISWLGYIHFPHDCFVFFSFRDISAVLSATMSIFSATCSGLPGAQYGWAAWYEWHQIVELFEGKKKLKIEMLRTGWNFQIARLTTRALRKNKNKKIFLCDLFYLFFADFFVFDITWKFEELGHSNLAVKWSLASRSRRHTTRRPAFQNFPIRRLWILVKNQKWIFLSRSIRH